MRQEWYIKSIVMTVPVHTEETSRKLTKRIKEHRKDNDDEKYKKKENITGLSQHMRGKGYRPASEEI